jgi:hypothetical protein
VRAFELKDFWKFSLDAEAVVVSFSLSSWILQLRSRFEGSSGIAAQEFGGRTERGNLLLAMTTLVETSEEDPTLAVARAIAEIAWSQGGVDVSGV